MLPVLQGPTNASSVQHPVGRAAAEMLDRARAHVRELVGMPDSTVVFTSGATEANNLALLGLAASTSSPHRRIVTTQIEHASVLEPLSWAADSWEVIRVRVDHEGIVDLDALRRAVDERTLVISVQVANSEIGTLQPLADIAEVAATRGAWLHTDAAQAAGVMALPAADAVTLSGHKIGGPQGSGALVLSGEMANALTPRTLGGGQENGLRSGTVNVAGAVGFGEACRLARVRRDSEAQRLMALRDRLLARLEQRMDLSVNGSLQQRLPHNLNVRLAGVDADALIANCRDVAFSAGSACAAATQAPSRVLQAIGLTAEAADESVRFGVGHTTTTAEIDTASDRICTAAMRILDRNVLA